MYVVYRIATTATNATMAIFALSIWLCVFIVFALFCVKYKNDEMLKNKIDNFLSVLDNWGFAIIFINRLDSTNYAYKCLKL